MTRRVLLAEAFPQDRGQGGNARGTPQGGLAFSSNPRPMPPFGGRKGEGGELQSSPKKERPLRTKKAAPPKSFYRRRLLNGKLFFASSSGGRKDPP